MKHFENEIENGKTQLLNEIKDAQRQKQDHISKRGQDMATCERYREAVKLKDREIERLKRILDVKENKVKWQNQVNLEKSRA